MEKCVCLICDRRKAFSSPSTKRSSVDDSDEMTIPELEEELRTASRPARGPKASADLDYDFSLLLDYDDIEYYNEIDNNKVIIWHIFNVCVA